LRVKQPAFNFWKEKNMEEFSNTPSDPSPSSGIKPLSFVFGLVAALVLGGVIGYGLGLYQAAQQPPAVVEVEVVVTATPGPEPPAVAQADEVPASAEETTNDPPASPDEIMEFLLADVRHVQGDADAPVTLIEFSDFQCGYCGRWAAETLPPIQEQYIDTGKVRFVYKHLAVLGPDSVRAAEASECAAEQDMFWDFHNQVFVDQAQNRTQLSVENLVTLAEGVGLDADAFNECLESGRYNSQVNQESMVIRNLGVNGTPGFVVNGVYIPGAQPFDVFKQIIDEELAKIEQ
jgi:protein-disulfide isomerase